MHTFTAIICLIMAILCFRASRASMYHDVRFGWYIFTFLFLFVGIIGVACALT